MLNTIKVKNFQSIESADVSLGKFTVFTGPSSSGKSALVRAVQATTRNSFTPSQVSQWAKESKVTLEFDDHTISAERGKSKSTYHLDDETFTKAGRAVPEKVSEALRLPEIADTESTFATQFDKPYLIADPGSVAAKVIGSLTNVSILHGSLRESNRRSLEAKSHLKVRVADIEEHEESLTQFDGLDLDRENLDKATATLEDIDRKHKDLLQLRTLMEKIENLHRGLEELTASVVDLSGLVGTVESMDSTDLIPLETVLTTMLKLTKEYSEVPEVSVPEVNLSEFESDVSTVSLLGNALSEVQRLGQALGKSREDYDTVVESVSKIRDEYDRLLIDVDVCPLCGSTVNGELHV